jgi:hypothetical protein
MLWLNLWCPRLRSQTHGFRSIELTVAQGVFKGLPGLRDQSPGSDLLKALNTPVATGFNPSVDYFALQSNYTPSGGLAKAILNAGVDRLFGEKQNDLIVPTLGVSEENRGKYFGQKEEDNVSHTDFFSRAETWKHILAHMP